MSKFGRAGQFNCFLVHMCACYEDFGHEYLSFQRLNNDEE